jgi:hypothetical protein
MRVAIGERMKTLALTFALALASAGCLGNFIPDPQPASHGDMAGTTGTGGNGGNGGSGGSGGENNASSTDMASTGVVSNDMAGQTPGTKAFGDLCTVNGDCQSLLCEQFAMGTVHRCTKPCTVATEATDCPAPSALTCTNNGYCKFNN